MKHDWAQGHQNGKMNSGATFLACRDAHNVHRKALLAHPFARAAAAVGTKFSPASFLSTKKLLVFLLAWIIPLSIAKSLRMHRCGEQVVVALPLPELPRGILLLGIKIIIVDKIHGEFSTKVVQGRWSLGEETGVPEPVSECKKCIHFGYGNEERKQTVFPTSRLPGLFKRRNRMP